MVAVCHLGFVGRILEHPISLFGGLYRYQKFGWNRSGSFHYRPIKVLIFCTFGLKTPIHTPKLGFWKLTLKIFFVVCAVYVYGPRCLKYKLD